jgi:hypothetical protein
LYTKKPVHREVFYAEKGLRKKAFTQRSLLGREIFTQRSFHTEKSLHRGNFTHRSFYTKKRLHTEAFTHRRLYTKNFYTNKPVRRGAFTGYRFPPGIFFRFAGDFFSGTLLYRRRHHQPAGGCAKPFEQEHALVSAYSGRISRCMCQI